MAPHCSCRKEGSRGTSTHSVNGREIVTLPLGEVGLTIRKGDVFSLGTLLSLANASLDERGKYASTFRRRGLTLVVAISYDNRPKHFLGLQVTPWHIPQTYYTYRVHAREAEDFHLETTNDDPSKDTRIYRSYFGVRVIVAQNGNLAVFTVVGFLMTLTTSLGLLAIANILTDLFMLYLFNKKHIYERQVPPFARHVRRSRPYAAEAAQCLIDAIEGGDAAAVVANFPFIVELLGKKD